MLFNLESAVGIRVGRAEVPFHVSRTGVRPVVHGQFYIAHKHPNMM